MGSSGTTAPEDLKAELVIIGGGGTGLAAAVTAKENGVGKVILLEKRGMPGGNTAMSMGPFGVDSPVQKRAAIEFHRDEVFKIAMNWAHWKINPRIVRAFIDKSGDTIRWLEDKGLEFKCLPLYPNQSPRTWHMPKGFGAEIVRVLVKECQKLGVEVLRHTPARKILLGPNGKVTGVLAEREGKEFTITTTSIIIGTGAFVNETFPILVHPDRVGLQGDSHQRLRHSVFGLNAYLQGNRLGNLRPR